MKKIIASLLAGLTIAGTAGATAQAASRPTEPHRWYFTARLTSGRWLPSCRTEDSRGCVWNGFYEGNRTGASFIAPHRGARIYLRVTSESFLVADPGRANTTRAVLDLAAPTPHVIEVDGTVRHRTHRYHVRAYR